MNIIERFGPWVAAAALLIAIVWIGSAIGSGRRRRSSSRTDAPGESADFRALDHKVNQVLADVRHATQQQGAQLGELRTFWANRLQTLEDRIEQWMKTGPAAAQASVSAAPVSGAAAAPGFSPRVEEAEPARPDRSDAWPRPDREDAWIRTDRSSAQPRPEADAWLRTVDDAAGYGADSLRALSSPPPPVSFPPADERGWTAGPGDRPVEIREGVLVASMSLPPAAYVSVEGGRARVYLNPDAPINEFALPKWEAFFDLAGAKPYASYRTRRPAEVRWDDAAARGDLIAKGTAEAI